MVSFAELIELPVFERREDRRKKVFKSFWMTSDENFEIIKRIEQEAAKKEAAEKEKVNIKKEAVAKVRKIKIKKKNAVKKIKSNPKLLTVLLETFSYMHCQIG